MRSPLPKNDIWRQKLPREKLIIQLLKKKGGGKSNDSIKSSIYQLFINKNQMTNWKLYITNMKMSRLIINMNKIPLNMHSFQSSNLLYHLKMSGTVSNSSLYF